ncbi:MAG: hypothetical protein COA58_09170 [Bacteroidetes bacterium]|nr:MAG: hypothetical protein COA58_09170 [Bacteroidota bacterium]
MKIKSNASPDELDSPFYEKNQKFCSEFEHFIADKNGKVKGNYNAWSYTIFGKITQPKNWTLKYKKAIFSSGNLWLSSKFQSLLVLTEWTTEIPGTFNSDFLIRKKKKTDSLKILFSTSVSKLTGYDPYIIKSRNHESQLISTLIKILDPLFKSREVYTIEHRHDVLRIELRTEEHHFDVFNELTKI